MNRGAVAFARLRQPGARRGGVHAHAVRHAPEMAGAVRAVLALGLVDREQRNDAFTRFARALGGGTAHHHAGACLALATRRQHPLAFDLDHAGPAVTVRAVAGCVLEAKVRDRLARAAGGLPETLPLVCGDLDAIQGQGKGIGHDFSP